MGILNVTPDSFSDGGLFYSTAKAVDQGRRLVDEGADIIDVGGESSRPGSAGVTEAEEKRRVVPVIEALSRCTDAVISIDTVKPGVASAAVDAGARMINDVSMLRYGNGLAKVAATANVDIILMHSRKTPQDMQLNIQYADVVRDVIAELLKAVDVAESAGVRKDQIWLDPGIGFAKTAANSVALLARLEEMTGLGFPVVVGPSRKSFIGDIAKGDVSDRIGGTAAAVTAAILGNATAVRVHDVATMKQAALIAFEIATINAPHHTPRGGNV
ncbi:MAG: dihydropteroate synthase [Myxococcota bacterium]|nr:dihydropteroate synthase [Myxococcota bacterium]